MEQNRNSYQLWWLYDLNIVAPATVFVPLGCNNATAFDAVGAGIGLVRDLRYFAFTLQGTYPPTATLSLKTEVSSVVASLQAWWTHLHSATGNTDTLHNVAAPYGNAQGIMTIATQFLRLSLVVGGSGTVTSFCFMARAWKE